jgi:hypothetical protein
MYFLMWCNQAALGRAAAQLRGKQPSVSDRSPQNIRPTIYGEALSEMPLRSVRSMEAGTGKIEFLSDPTTGEVNSMSRVASPYTTAFSPAPSPSICSDPMYEHAA